MTWHELNFFLDKVVSSYFLFGVRTRLPHFVALLVGLKSSPFFWTAKKVKKAVLKGF